MDHFQRSGPSLYAEEVALDEIAERFGTPTYVYSRATITRHIKVLHEGLGDLSHVVCYAIKANANLAILDLIRSLQCGFDAVSIGELARALKVGAAAKSVIFSGVGKRDDEIRAALRTGVLYISVESPAELDRIAAIAAETGSKAPVSIRVNPDVDARTHPYIATGLRHNKFGVPLEQARDLYRRMREMESIDAVGVTCHIGSQITEMEPFADAAQRMAALARDLMEAGTPLRYLGMGGGLGIAYRSESPPLPREYGATLSRLLGPLGLTLVVEPGRVIVGNAGVLLTRVVRVKEGAERRFVLVDAGMNDLVRPALYDAYHAIEPVTLPDRDAVVGPVDVVGPVCESSDTFGKATLLPPLGAGELLAIRGAGAYGFTMASNYNGRPRPAEVLVDGAQATLIRERESLATLWHGERTLSGSVATDELPAPLEPTERNQGELA